MEINDVMDEVITELQNEVNELRTQKLEAETEIEDQRRMYETAIEGCKLNYDRISKERDSLAEDRDELMTNLRDSKGEIVRCNGMIRDLTEKKNAVENDYWAMQQKWEQEKARADRLSEALEEAQDIIRESDQDKMEAVTIKIGDVTIRIGKEEEHED